MAKYLFTSESVSEGHPDKVCDQISDAILDECLRQDPDSRVALNSMIKNNDVFLLGEITTKAKIDYEKIARNKIKEIGYAKDEYGFNYDNCKVHVHIVKQSADIAMGVSTKKTKAEEQGAGDQGLMFGFACTETPDYMPLGIELSHQICSKLAQVRKNGKIKYLRPDGKAQVTLEYENEKPKKVTSIVVSCQHDENVNHKTIEEDIISKVIKPVCSSYIDKDTKFYVNPTGKFVIGGPVGDTGLTGRKIIVDSYGGYARHGGGAFSGKDPSKVDRSGAYMMRYIAKNIIASGIAKKCELQVAYVIGVADPVSVSINCFGTSKVPESKIITAIKENFDVRPGMIIKNLDLKRPLYEKTARYGHFGKNANDRPWEKTDKIKIFKDLLK